MRTVGIEEELLLVDATEGRPRAVAERILRSSAAAGPRTDAAPGGSLEHELQQQQLETDTPPRTEMADLDADIREWRDKAIDAARREGARVLATGTSPMPVEPSVFHDSRYQQMVERFGITTHEQLTCGCHVHVSVDSAEEGVGVLDRIRTWLPPLLAISANSPFWQGADSQYASFRSQAIVRWPTVGPQDIFGSAHRYRQLVADMLNSGVLLDEGMVYFDARLSHRYPTVEIRVADVCLDARDTVLIAALCRGLVDTAAAQWQAGEDADPVSSQLLRLATWQAGRYGLEGDLLDPGTSRPQPATHVVHHLIDHIRPALRDNGDESLVDERLGQVLTRGNGAVRQRAVLERTGQLTDVIADLARVTAGQESS
ncbi:glutamate--cysteine ligase 2 [Aeromicrobium sp. P5_D10]